MLTSVMDGSFAGAVLQQEPGLQWMQRLLQLEQAQDSGKERVAWPGG